MIPKVPTSAKELAALIKLGEGKTLEFKRSTGELKEGLQTLCAFLNGTGGMVLFGVRPDGKTVIKRSGVVLIDEIDAHLHPEWQRVIGFWLKRHFPNIQFLVTTHSPIICQAADPNGLFVLPEPASDAKPCPLSPEEYNKVIAARPDTILLSSAFGLHNTRSPRAVAGRAEFAKLEAKKRAGGNLTPDEKDRAEQLQLFAAPDEEA